LVIKLSAGFIDELTTNLMLFYLLIFCQQSDETRLVAWLTKNYQFAVINDCQLTSCYKRGGSEYAWSKINKLNIKTTAICSLDIVGNSL